jgi:hypothetical protein
LAANLLTQPVTYKPFGLSAGLVDDPTWEEAELIEEFERFVIRRQGDLQTFADIGCRQP